MLSIQIPINVQYVPKTGKLESIGNSHNVRFIPRIVNVFLKHCRAVYTHCRAKACGVPVCVHELVTLSPKDIQDKLVVA